MNVAAAISVPHWIRVVPDIAQYGDRQRLGRSFDSTSANRKLFHDAMNARMEVAAMPGAVSGNDDARQHADDGATVDHRRLLDLRGNASINPTIIQTVSGSVKIRWLAIRLT